MFAPQRHTGQAGGDDRFTAQEKRGLHHFKFQAELLTQKQCFGNVWRILEAIMQVQTIKAAAEILHVHAFARRDIRFIFGHHRQEYHAFMQHFVMRQIVQQCMRHAFAAGGHEYRGAGDARRRVRQQAFDEGFQGDGAGLHALQQYLTSTFPSGEQREDEQADQEREPAALEQFE